MKVNENSREVVLSIEQWSKIDKILNEVNLNQAQQRQFGEVKWHMAKFNSVFSAVRQRDEARWRMLRQGVGTILRRLAQPPFDNCFEVLGPAGRDGVSVAKLVVEGTYVPTKRTELVRDSHTGIEFLAKPVPFVKYRLKDSCAYYHASALEFHKLIMSRLLLPEGDKQLEIDLDFFNPKRRIGA